LFADSELVEGPGHRRICAFYRPKVTFTGKFGRLASCTWWREAKESRRCLRFVKVCRLANHERLGNLEDEARQIASIFAAIVINTRKRAEEEKKKRKSGKPKKLVQLPDP
jgi:hypothetical protein